MSHPSIPEPGFYKMRLCRGGPFVPVFIATARDGDICAWRYPEGAVDPFKVWPWCAKHRISEADFNLLVSYCQRAQTELWRPHANPYKPVDYYGESLGPPEPDDDEIGASLGGADQRD